jgi:D-alanyl-D-alanine carboxypeptidase
VGPRSWRLGAWSLALLLVLTACSGGEEPRSAPSGNTASSTAEGSDAQVADAAAAAVEERLDLYEGDYPGALALIRVGEETRFITAGYADVPSQEEMSDRHRFQIGSVTKTMVSTALLQLVESGDIELSDTVEQWLPGLVPGGDRITIEQLLSMRSGLYDYTESPRFRWQSQRDPTEQVALAMQEPPPYAPDETSSYSNTNYLLLGLLLESATGQDLAAVLQDRVFTPLDMSDTSLLPARVTEPPLVQGYEGRRDVTLEDLVSCCWAAGGVVSSARDLDTFIGAVLDGSLLPPETVGAMTRSRGLLVNRGGTEYGLGVGRQTTPCGPALGHGGGLPGFATEAWVSEDSTRSAIVLVNDEGSGDVAQELLLTALCT